MVVNMFIEVHLCSYEKNKLFAVDCLMVAIAMHFVQSKRFV